MLKNKKIVFCIVSLGKGGAERVVSILANNFVKNNDVSIVTIVNEKVQYELDSRINLVELGKNSKKSKHKIINKIMIIPKFIKRLHNMKKTFKKIEPDIIVSFLPEACYFSVMANKDKYKLIISDRNDPNQEYKNIIDKIFMEKLYPKADGFVFQTEDAKKYFDDIIDFENKISDIIVNPVNPQFKDCPKVENRVKNIVSVGRLTEQKNMKMLIEAFYDLHDKFPEYNLIIYGDGNKREELENKIKELKMEKRIFLPGVANDIKEKIYNASLFVLPSNYEGIPNALIEAMTIGLPVISTDCPCGGPRMFIKNEENGILTEVNNKEELTKKIIKVLENEKLRENMGENAKKIIKKVDIDVIKEKWEFFISNVIKTNY